MKKRIINLTDVEKLRQLNTEKRHIIRNDKSEPVITVTGTFPIAKFWNSETLKKEKYAETLSVNAAVITQIRVKWIIATADDIEIYLKLTEDARGNVTYVTQD